MNLGREEKSQKGRGETGIGVNVRREFGFNFHTSDNMPSRAPKKKKNTRKIESVVENEPTDDACGYSSLAGHRKAVKVKTQG